MTNPFVRAREVVEAWFDGPGANFVTRVAGARASKSSSAWKLTINHPRFSDSAARIVLPRDFPASPAQVYVSPSLCLVLPHVEETGKICLGMEALTEDYDEPASAVGRVLHAFVRFLEQCKDERWIADELQRECWAYWVRHCKSATKKSSGRRVARQMALALTAQRKPCERTVAVYFDDSRHKGPRIVVGCQGDEDAHALAQRHGFGDGQLVHGRALFVSMPTSQLWMPGKWPTEIDELDQLVAVATSEEVSLRYWVQELPDGLTTPSFVVLVRGLFAYAYQLLPPLIPLLTSVTITPVPTVRIDASWALTRGHDTATFDGRQSKRVLLLGCGSLGAPVAELLARAGVGKLILVDPDVFLPENCARHVLGISASHASKVAKLADRLSREVPGVTVQGVSNSASAWVSDCAKPGMFDLVVDCTGENSVRAMLARYRHTTFGGVQIVHAWLEPFCAAAHTVLLEPDDVWPDDDPADSKVNAADWPEATKVDIPACGAGFHPYGAADVMQVAGFTAERLLSVLDGTVSGSKVWSWVRTTKYFDELRVGAVPRAIVPLGSNRHDSVMVTRDLGQVLYGDA